MKNQAIPTKQSHPKSTRCLSIVTPVLFTLASCAAQPHTTQQTKAAFTQTAPTTTITRMSEVTWEPLNPARGNDSPLAANVWGNRNDSGSSGFFVRFVDGFKSPPHIHNVSYRGVVLRSLVHNDDPNADNLWMPVGSYWTQPKGGVHVTAAHSGDTVAYIEIDEGPYLVHPTDKAFPSGEQPINVDVSNLVWLDVSHIRGYTQLTSTTDMRSRKGEPQIALLWGNPFGKSPGGLLLKLPAGSGTRIGSQGSTFRMIVVNGKPVFDVPNKANKAPLNPGDALSSNAQFVQVSCDTNMSCLLYVRVEGRLGISPAKDN